MALIRWNPFGEFTRFGRPYDSVFNGRLWNDSTECDCDWTPDVDIFDGEKEIVLTAELPGLSQEEVKVNIENNILTVSGERSVEHKEDKGGFTRRERYYGNFSRSFRVPDTVDQSNINATMDKGVLTVTLPKSEKALPKQIEVKIH